MVYISPYTNKFYFSKDACIKLTTINSYFQRIVASIESCTVREYIKTCRYIPKTTTVELIIPKFSFKLIVCDYFYYKGLYYFVATDRLLCWTEQLRVKVIARECGANAKVL